MNKVMSFLNIIIEIINRSFKLIIIICIITYLIIYYHSTLNNRYQYHSDGSSEIVFDTKKGEIYTLMADKFDKESSAKWLRMSPFGEADAIPVKYNVHHPSK